MALMPVVTVKEADRIQRWLAVTGPDLQAEAGPGLRKVKDVNVELAHWPDEAKQVARTGSAWQITRDDAQVKLVQRSLASAPPIQVLLSEQESALGAGQRWVHQAHLLVFARRGADLHLTLPAGARLLSLSLDEIPVTPRQPAHDHCWLPLAGPAGQHSVRLRWIYDAGEALERPNLAAPAVKGAAATDSVGVIRVPAGLDPADTTPSVDIVVHRALAQMNLSKLLGERLLAGTLSPAGLELLQAQQRFFSYCRHADYLAGKTGRPAHWLEKVKKLRRENSDHARQFAFEKTKIQAEEKTAVPDTAGASGLFGLPGDGLPAYWRQNRPAPPVLALTSRINEQAKQALLASEAFLLVLVAFLALSCFPHLAGRLAVLWPEQLILLGWLGWTSLGASLVGALLVATGVSARFILLAAWVQRLFRRALTPRPGSSFLPGA
jgi:hypothetical protein